jgi:hypothetical protein
MPSLADCLDRMNQKRFVPSSKKRAEFRAAREAGGFFAPVLAGIEARVTQIQAEKKGVTRLNAEIAAIKEFLARASQPKQPTTQPTDEKEKGKGLQVEPESASGEQSPGAGIPAEDQFAAVSKLAEVWRGAWEKDQGGRGIQAGSGNIDKLWDYEGMTMVASLVRKGSTITDAVAAAKADARQSIKKHNARRPKDPGWVRDEGSADKWIEHAGNLLSPPQSPPPSTSQERAEFAEPVPAGAPPTGLPKDSGKSTNVKEGKTEQVEASATKTAAAENAASAPKPEPKTKIEKAKAKPQKRPAEDTDDGYTWTPPDDDPTDSKGAGIAGSLGGALLHPSTAPTTPALPIKSQREIIRDLAEGLRLPIRFGRLTTTKFGGYFKKVQDLIGSKRANDLPVVSHEVGHKLDEMFALSKNPTIAKELDRLGDPATPGSRSSWTKTRPRAYKYGEGVAEFVRYWLTDPAAATAAAPLTEAEFNTALDANPDVGDVLRQAQADIQNWLKAPEAARLASSISIGGNPNKTRYGMSQLTRDLVNDLHFLSVVADDASKLGKPLRPSENFYMNARLLRGGYGMAERFIHKGVTDFTTKEVTLGTSFEDALKPAAGKIDALRLWMVAKRAQELRAQGRESGLVPSDVDAVAAMHDGDPIFEKAFADLKAWQDAALQYVVDAGYTSKESAEAMREMNKDYVPFHRVFEIGAGESPSQEGMGMGRGLNVGKVSSLKRLTGSTRDIVDPLEAMMRNTYALITAAEKSAISAQIGAMAERPGMGKWVEKIATPKEAARVDIERIRKQLEGAGADLTNVPDDLVMTFFQASGAAPWGENIIKVTTDGKTTFYRLHKDLYDAFHALDLDDSSKLIQILSSPAQLLRAGVTLDPAFGGANVIRDAFSSAVINRYGLFPFQAAAKGVMALINNPKLVAEWAAAGGEQTFEANYFDREKSARLLRERITKDLTPAERALVWVKSPLMALRWISSRMETVTRIGEYKTAYDAARSSGMDAGDARRQAAFESRDRQDFAMGGAKTKILRHAAAFWNAGLQSNVAIYKAFRDRPVRTTLQGLAYITAPTLALMAINHDDEDYWDRPQWERDVFWLIPIGKDDNGHTEFLRIPKPFILGIMFGAFPERLVAASKDRKNAFKELGQRVSENTVPNPLPNALLMMLEPSIGDQGYVFWRDRPIIPDSMKELPPEFQVTEQTSLTARRIGKLAGISPMKVDHFIASATGGLGKQVVHNAIDRSISAITGEKKTNQNSGPAARFFTSPAGISSQSVEDFYQRITELRKQNAGSKVGGAPMAPADRGQLQRMEQAADVMTALRKSARRITDPAAKQKLYLRISDLARKTTEPVSAK